MTQRSVLRALGALWLLDAGLQSQSVMFGAQWWRTDLAGAAMGEPPWLAHLILGGTGVVAAHAAGWNAVFVVVQAMIGLSLLTGRFTKWAVAISIPWALGVWVVGEGLGMLPTGFAMMAFGAPGAVLLYPLIAVLAGAGRNLRRLATGSWVFLWAGLSLLQIPYAFPARQVLAADFEEMPHGLAWMHGVGSGHPVALSAGLAVVQVVIGVGVLRWRRPALIGGVAVSLFFWVCFQGMGGLLDGAATDPGTAPLMVLLAGCLWPGPGRRLVVGDGEVPSVPAFGEELTAVAVA